MTVVAGSKRSGGARSWRDRPVLAWAALGVVLLLGAAVLGRTGGTGLPFDPDSTEDLGTRALVLLAEETGARVDTGVAVPSAEHDVAVVFRDAVADIDALDAWVEDGGTLVVAAPASELHPFTPAGEAFSGFFDTTLAPGACAIDALEQVESIDSGGGVVFARRSGADGCFGTLDGFFVLATDRGDGTVVALGGPGPLVNRSIDEADNAVLAAALLAPSPGTSVAFIRPPLVGEGGEVLSPADLIGDNVRQALVQLVVAFVLYALWRARRLGRPRREARPVELAASDLVVAVGNLLHQADRRDQAAAVVADDLRRALAGRLGLGADARPEQVAEIAAARTGLSRDRLLAALDPSPLSGADDLVALAQATESIRQEVSNVRR
jgi:hypothetical protein